MTAKRLSPILILVLAVLATGSVSGQAADQFPFDVGLRDSCLTVWVDLSELPSSDRARSIREGLDFLVSGRVQVRGPALILGSRVLGSTEFSAHFSYDPISREYKLRSPSGHFDDCRFASMASFRRFLRDSISVCVVPVDSLDSETRVKVHLLLTTIQLTDINLATQSSAESSPSPIRYLFRQFLTLSGYGREEFEMDSRWFSLSELNVEP